MLYRIGSAVSKGTRAPISYVKPSTWSPKQIRTQKPGRNLNPRQLHYCRKRVQAYKGPKQIKWEPGTKTNILVLYQTPYLMPKTNPKRENPGRNLNPRQLYTYVYIYIIILQNGYGDTPPYLDAHENRTPSYFNNTLLYIPICKLIFRTRVQVNNKALDVPGSRLRGFREITILAVRLGSSS